MLAPKSSDLPEVQSSLEVVQALPRIGVLNLSGYICEVPSF